MTLARPAVTLDSIRDAARMLDGVAYRTPVQTSRAISQVVGVPVLLKCENLQRAGSFKIRGAYIRMARLTAEEKARGVVAASAGNHAQGVAFAAGLLGIQAVVYMPVDAALPKVAATREYGAEVRLVGVDVDETLAAAKAEAERTGAVFIHPFDHPDVVAGQGTLALEILEQVPDVRTVVMPLGGGGLVAGVAAAMAEAAPHVKVVGVQAARAAAYPGSLAAGVPTTSLARSTMADGIAVGTPGPVPFSIVSELGSEVRTVTEDELSRALLMITERAKLVVEPAGAAGVAALLADPTGWEGPVVVILSGGNIDPLVLLRVLRHGLAAAGRYMQMQVLLDDRPGALAQMLDVIAGVGGSIMHIDHDRTDVHLAIGEAWVRMQVETKGQEHCEALVAQLRGAGYRVLAG
ncbi:threonine dehydratase [Oerskovia sp. Root918]|uniref:threonine ammonia-lyase n=2 Tax=Cellulomonadaceae TaxID=85016 RepID=A0A161XJM3_9CELL|nr:threonine dehydratase [Oerskovia sp. Root22]KRD47421.1 threonine dehydratase [Oerskovia sp. Root918]KZM36977.1 L-threonine dehydratase catabolic TdcB [Oerskovia enterophila]OCI32495.1 L-threonine dehydratase catabolic TdcB [Oerskovia enterophila]